MNNRLEQIPTHLWGQQIPLNLQTISSLEQTSHVFNFFNKQSAQKTTPVKQIMKLMHFIFHDKLTETKELIENQPQIILTQLKFITPENTIEHISPFQYALMIPSTHFVNLFIEHAGTQFKAELVRQFHEKPAYKTLNTYSKIVDRYVKEYVDYLINKNNILTINATWLLLGNAQKLIPLWLLKKLLCDRKNNNQEGIAYAVNNEQKILNIAKHEDWCQLGKYTVFKGSIYLNRLATAGHYTNTAFLSASVTHDLRNMNTMLINAKQELNKIQCDFLKAENCDIAELEYISSSGVKRNNHG